MFTIKTLLLTMTSATAVATGGLGGFASYNQYNGYSMFENQTPEIDHEKKERDWDYREWLNNKRAGELSNSTATKLGMVRDKTTELQVLKDRKANENHNFSEIINNIDKLQKSLAQLELLIFGLTIEQVSLEGEIKDGNAKIPKNYNNLRTNKLTKEKVWSDLNQEKVRLEELLAKQEKIWAQDEELKIHMPQKAKEFWNKAKESAAQLSVVSYFEWDKKEMLRKRLLYLENLAREYEEGSAYYAAKVLTNKDDKKDLLMKQALNEYAVREAAWIYREADTAWSTANTHCNKWARELPKLEQKLSTKAQQLKDTKNKATSIREQIAAWQRTQHGVFQSMLKNEVDIGTLTGEISGLTASSNAAQEELEKLNEFIVE